MSGSSRWGWYNNHHAFPTSARRGLSWWQIDVSYCLIRLLAWLGLAWRVRLPAAEPFPGRAAESAGPVRVQ